MAQCFLLVDADRNFREALAIALRLDGHRVEVCVGADEALALLAAGGVDCCLVDAHMPGADEVLAAATAAGARPVMTGPYADVLEQAARRHPAATALPKPFRAAELADAGRAAQ
ncbi:response regulator receiver protein [Anaeromyxobacter sp. K]|uniref:response regulator n=1 Tax=Anaeromyxobacter sp. (strain K) TaxID=447217 RepID=UPI00015F855B|nr:response regulator [Anaeromyxobacter sp. K]ACG71686.1 response regulator receiver protein [Anaeromyxobacter sp. K]